MKISVINKKQFIKWFISNQLADDYEISWFLEDLLNDEQALLNIHFVEDIQHCPKGIIISTYESSEKTFLFFKGSIYTTDVYTAYHELHLYREEALYIQMNFPFTDKNILYKTVLEEEISCLQHEKIIAEQLLHYLLNKGKRSYLKRRIDLALENKDYDQFIYLSNELIKINNNK